jgi:diguanylate cyclase
VQTAVSRSGDKLLAGRSRATELESRVQELELELRRLSEEVSTDQLTQVANRRGLLLAFGAEVAQANRESGRTLAVGLIDIDNFKKLNDSLGHAAGDQALKALAAGVRQRLRPQDHLARFGGEEFVVLLPQTDLDEAEQALTRLQRSLSEALFLHEGREVFVTFSAGVTAWRPGEELQPALERADQGLYEAKRTGKNRTCRA